MLYLCAGMTIVVFMNGQVPGHVPKFHPQYRVQKQTEAIFLGYRSVCSSDFTTILILIALPEAKKER